MTVISKVDTSMLLVYASLIAVSIAGNVDFGIDLDEESPPAKKDKPGEPHEDHPKLRIRGTRALQTGISSLEFIRFSKVRFDEDYKNDAHLPLTALDYPLSDDKRDIIRDSNGVSVITNSDIIPRFEGSITNVNDVLQSSGMITGPTYPADGDVYWNDLDIVVQAQLQRQKCGSTLMAKDVWDVPQTWEKFNLNEAAEAVHDEYPGYWQAKHLESVFGPFGSNFSVDYNIIGRRSKVEFLLGAVMMAEINTWAVGCVATYNFISKWKYGRSRPEEIAWMIQKGEIGVGDGVPQDLISKVMELKNFNKNEDFTAYPEGSPRHPSWPAMHSAASNLSMWMSVLFHLTPEQMEEAKKVDFAVSYARTVAGVHYMTDNVDGLNFGQEILSQELPYYLEATFGSDPDAVRQKIQSIRFDWKDYYQVMESTPALLCPRGTLVPAAVSSHKSYDCFSRNPCYDSAHDEHTNGHFFSADNACQFIECGDFGRCFKRNCAPGYGWNPSLKVCTMDGHECPRKRHYDHFSN